MSRWRADAAEARAARERLAAQLAASNPVVGRRGEGLLSARRRQKQALNNGGAAGVGPDAELLLGDTRDDLDNIAPQVRERHSGRGV